jgi:phospholipase A1
MKPRYFQLLLAAVCVLLAGCAGTRPATDTNQMTLPENIKRATAREQQRINDFPDLPDSEESAPTDDDVVQGVEVDKAPGALSERAIRERSDALEPYAITAHKPNFLLPFSYSTRLNKGAYENTDFDSGSNFSRTEVNFQISIKSQLNGRDLLLKDDGLFAAFTLEAWWQLYADDLSSPFRETNYQPELFYLKPLLWGPFGGSTALLVGIEHQSNGQFQSLSRSWNRIYGGFIYERGGLVARVRPWYRISEPEAEFPFDPDGDDNPDILDFMGHGDISVGLRHGDSDYSMLLRANPSTGKGAIDLNWTFPAFARFRVLLNYFNGYGDSLIDYNHHQQRFSAGVALTPLF